MLLPAQSEMRNRLHLCVDTLASDIGERNVHRPAALENAAKYLEAQLEGYGYKPHSQTYRAGGIDVRNIYVEKGGSAPNLPVLVVGAHYDSIIGTTGANDNGSGVAALMEIARALSDVTTERSVIVVFFVNEEPPHFQTDAMGSYVFANMLHDQKRPLLGMIALETIGYYSEVKGSQHYPGPLATMYPEMGNFIGFVGDSGSAKWVEAVTHVFQAQSDFPSEFLAAPAQLTGVSWSDHWSFSQFGYPALMVTDTAPFRYPHYHTAEDTPDKIDYDRMTRVVAGLIASVQTLAKK
jgi:Zn-dependent M28 family amino/carboxypeptidase